MEPKHFLPYDYCRCMGEGCDLAEQCMRYLTKDDLGPWTPMANRLCRVERREYDHQIPVRLA